MKTDDHFAAGVLKKARNQRMDHAGQRRTHHLEPKAKRHAHMLEIALTDTLGMFNKQLFQHSIGSSHDGTLPRLA
jgi:hypothetical protein